jgi:3-carboxy-cis,cis-muconate cycloisomerase
VSDLFWPGDERAGSTFDDESYVAALVAVEQAWLEVLGRPADLSGLVVADDLSGLAVRAEAGGNPVLGLVALLRERSGEPLVHRGLTSQDVVDTALVLMLRQAVGDVRADVQRQVRSLAALVEAHRSTRMSARTLGQPAVPTTFGLRAATWLTGLLDARDDLAALGFPVQLGGAAGTLAAVVELDLDPAGARTRLAGSLGLESSVPWHTTRRPLTRAGDAMVACHDAWGRIAGDVVTLSRPEIGELAEGAAGGSSTMPHKQNPVLSVLLRRAAITAPHLAATLHAAAADQVDERAAGGWHAEWDTLRLLARRSVTSASQATALLGGLRIDAARMQARHDEVADDLLAEQRTMAGLLGRDPRPAYLGASDAIIDEVLARAADSPHAPSGRTP